MLSWFDRWVTITVNVPVLILFLVIVSTAIVLCILALQRSRQRLQSMTQRLEQLSAEAELTKHKTSSMTASPDAYLQFIYNLSHEVSNPLQSVQTNLENMADCSPAEVGRWKQYYAIIRQEMKRLSTLTENLRLLSQLESVESRVKREPLNLRSVIEDVIMAQAERAELSNIHLTYEGPNRPARVLGDRGLLHEVILNLVDNSIKYSKETGGNIVIKLHEEPRVMHVTVKDDGLGIPAEDLPFIFNTAYRSSNKLTVHRKGSGLGLAIVKRIVDQHDGQIHADSTPAQGTTVSVELPLYSPD